MQPSGARYQLAGLGGLGVDDPLVDTVVAPAHVNEVDDTHDPASPHSYPWTWGLPRRISRRLVSQGGSRERAAPPLA